LWGWDGSADLHTSFNGSFQGGDFLWPNAVGDGGTLGAFVARVACIASTAATRSYMPVLPPLPQIDDHCVAADFRGPVSAVGRGECVARHLPGQMWDQCNGGVRPGHEEEPRKA
jgi:hypothetical protein